MALPPSRTPVRRIPLRPWRTRLRSAGSRRSPWRSFFPSRALRDRPPTTTRRSRTCALQTEMANAQRAGRSWGLLRRLDPVVGGPAGHMNADVGEGRACRPVTISRCRGHHQPLPGRRRDEGSHRAWSPSAAAEAPASPWTSAAAARVSVGGAVWWFHEVE